MMHREILGLDHGQPGHDRRRSRRRNLTLLITVSRHHKKWRARIAAYGKRMELGHFDTEEEAAEAYRKAGRKYHGEFFNPGYPVQLELPGNP
jgi:hypothetical protein